MNIEEAEAWIGGELTENQTKLVDYLSEGTIKGNERVLVCTAYGLGDLALLSTEVPEAVLTQVYGSGNVSELTLGGLALKHKVTESGEVCFLLSANYELPNSAPSRSRYTSADDVAQWIKLIGEADIDIITVEEQQALFNTDEEQ